MNKLASLLLGACLSLAVGASFAQDAMKKDAMAKPEMKDDAMAKDAMKSGAMEKDGMKK